MKRRNFIKTGGIASALMLVPNNVFCSGTGNIKDIITGKPVKDAVLKFYDYPSGEPIGESTTDSDGNYNSKVIGIRPTPWSEVKLQFRENTKRLEKLASSIVRAEITHPDHYYAVRYFDINGTGDATITGLNFDMDFFDAWARGGKKSVRRWDTNPIWYINIKNAEQPQVDEVKEIIQNDLVQFTNGFINPIVKETSEQVNERGSIYIYWIESGDYYGNHAEILENNEITSASTWFLKSNKLRRIYLRQLTQVLGFVNNPSNKEFYSDDGHYTIQGIDCGRFLYNTKIGNISPDSDVPGNF